MSFVERVLVKSGSTADEVWSYPDRTLTRRYLYATFSYRFPVESLRSTPTPLPTSMPSTPQRSITVTSGMLPTYTVSPPGESLEMVEYGMALYLGGRNTDSAGRYLSVRVHRNGVQVAGASTSFVAAGEYWTFSVFISPVNVGDVIDAYVWADASTVNLDYDAYWIYVTNVVPRSTMLFEVNFDTTWITLFSGSPAVYENHYLRLYSGGTWVLVDNATSGRASNCYAKDVFLETRMKGGALRLGRSSTSRPYYVRQYTVRTLGVVY